MRIRQLIQALTVFCCLGSEAPYVLLGQDAQQGRGAVLIYYPDTVGARLLIAGLPDLDREEIISNFVLKWEGDCPPMSCSFLEEHFSGFNHMPPPNGMPGNPKNETALNADLLTLGPGSLWIRSDEELSMTNFHSVRGGESLLDLGSVVDPSIDFAQLRDALTRTYVAALGSGGPKQLWLASTVSNVGGVVRPSCDFDFDGDCDNDDVDMLTVMFDLHVPQPCDFNEDGQCDVDDVDELVDQFGINVDVDPSAKQFNLNGDMVIDQADKDVWDVEAMNHPVVSPSNQMYDLNGDEVINIDDLHVWRGLAGLTIGLRTEDNNFARILRGDSNVDGDVDFSDFLVLSANYRDNAAGNRWSRGNFKGSDVTDFSDFLVLSSNFGVDLTPVDPTLPVPEPSGMLLMATAILYLARCLPSVCPRTVAPPDFCRNR